MKPPTRVLIVDDSAVSRLLFRRMLSEGPGFEVVGEAVNGKQALSMIPECLPDLVLMDIAMPIMDGLMATQELMKRFPRPVLLVSDVHDRDAAMNFKALAAGALDLVGKPSGREIESGRAGASLRRRVGALAEVPVIRRRAISPAAKPIRPGPSVEATGDYRLLCIGASTGGPPAILQVLRSLGKSAPWPVAIVQHMAQGFIAGMVRWLGELSGLPVHLVEGTVSPKSGHVYIAPDAHHLEVLANGDLGLTSAPPLGEHRPAVNALFASAARARTAPQTLAVLLTGMGQDGAEGMKALRDSGAYTIAQDEASSVVFGMPRAARDLGAAVELLPLDEIGPRCLGVSAAQAERPFKGMGVV